MGSLALLRWLADLVRTDEAVEVDEARAARLADAADDPTVTREVLTGEHGRSRHPLATYLEPDERPASVFRGSRLLIDDGESVARAHPFRELQVVVSDRRLLFVVGNRFADDLYEVPRPAVVDGYLDEDGVRRHLVVEADRDGDRLTFFADVTLEPAVESLDEAVADLQDGRS